MVDLQDFPGVDPTGATDSSSGFQAAYDAVKATGGTVYCPQGTYRLDSPLAIDANHVGWVRIVGDGMGATVFRAGGTNGQFTKFNKSGDDPATFRYIEITDLTFDCADQASGRGHVLIGVMPWASPGGWSALQTRLDLDNIALRRVQAANVPTDETRTNYGVLLMGVVVNSSDTNQLDVTDIVLEDCRVDGGAIGYAIGGTAKNGTLLDGNVKVFCDRIHVERCYWDSGVVPQAAGTQGFGQFGGVGFGGSLRIRDCYGANSSDIGIEVDGMTDAVVEGCEMVDCWREGYLIRNFRTPASLAAQRNVVRDCVARNVAVDPASGAGTSQVAHYMVGGDTTTAHFRFGHAAFVNCVSRFDGPLANVNSRGLAVSAYSAQYEKLTVRDLDVGAQNYAAAHTAAAAPSWIDVVPAYVTAEIEIDGVNVRLNGTRSGTGSVTQRFIRLSGTAKAEIRNVTVECLVTGMASGTETHHVVGIGDTSGSTIRARVEGVTVVAYSSDASVHGVTLAGTGTLTIPADARIVATGFDLSGAPAGFGFDYNIDASQRRKFVARDIAGQRTTGGSGPPTGPTTITPGANPFVHQNNDPIVEDVVVSGGVMTSPIEFSDDGTSFFSTGLQSGVFRLGPGQAIKVTYTTPPALAMRKIPAR